MNNYIKLKQLFEIRKYNKKIQQYYYKRSCELISCIGKNGS